MTPAVHSLRPFVHLGCAGCDWSYDVPQEDIGLEGVMPFARWYPPHACPGGDELRIVERRRGYMGY